ncbi:WS/DGAT/MGAT family O-acyltransferase [Rhabdothermincola sediminis]|uniref:WS/DGAT/MGAT family O-acyltransferase n=1 Tax=Rhabdothermincola sediminis TaxID=2751370 RepID=UPI001AA01321|nr:wax ester/triacylglycerol synthase family O-acyltransferase [Rhabdothermincola sediminis]
MQRLSGLDAGFLYMETPTLHMHTLKVAILEPPAGAPLPFEAMREEIGARLGLLPGFRQRLLEVPFGFHHPVWVDDPAFDLGYHVRRVVLPPPGNRRQLDDTIGQLAGDPLERDRPLWQMYVIEGSEDGRLAVLVKIHHAMADGAAASALLANVMSFADGDDGEGETVLAGSTEAWRPAPLPGGGRLLLDAFVDHLRQLARLPRLLVRTLANLRAVLRHRRRSVVSTPVPILSTPRTSFNTALTSRRSFATTRLPLEDARAVKAAFGVTLNDVVLAVVAGAMRAYLSERGELPSRPLVAGVPVGTDAGGDGRLGGNRVSNLFTSLATDEPDPVRRLLRIHEVTAEAKAMQAIIGPETFASWVQYTPPRPYAWVVRQYSGRHLADRHPPPINLVVSNVPGPSRPLRTAGAHLMEIYSVGPILEGIGLNVTVWSYLDGLYVGTLACPDTLPDPHRITDAMHDALGELVASARQASDAPCREPVPRSWS